MRNNKKKLKKIFQVQANSQTSKLTNLMKNGINTMTEILAIINIFFNLKDQLLKILELLFLSLNRLHFMDIPMKIKMEFTLCQVK